MPINRERALETAQKFYEQGELENALLEYQQVLEEDPKNPGLLLKIGGLHMKMETYADAIEAYDKLARIYASQGFVLRAIAVFRQVRVLIAEHVPEIEERYAHVLPALVQCYQQLGLVEEARAAHDELAARERLHKGVEGA